MLYDEICEELDDMGVGGDTPIRFKFDGVVLDVDSIQHDRQQGVVTLILVED